MKSERCEQCPDEHTSACDTCGNEPEVIKLTYDIYINEEIYNIEGLHNDLDDIVGSLGLGLLKSTLESTDEISEHDYQEGENSE